MAQNGDQAVLYVGPEKESEEAIAILKGAGFDVDVQSVPLTHPIAVRFGTPVLFGLSGKFEGVDGVRIFVKNATLLGYPPRKVSSV